MQCRPVWDGVILSHYGVPIISDNDVVLSSYLKGHHYMTSLYIEVLAILVGGFLGEGKSLSILYQMCALESEGHVLILDSDE